MASLYLPDVQPKDGSYSAFYGQYLGGAFSVKNVGTERATYAISAPVPTDFTYAVTTPPTTVDVEAGQTVPVFLTVQAPYIQGLQRDWNLTASVTAPNGAVTSSTGKVTLKTFGPAGPAFTTYTKGQRVTMPGNAQDSLSFVIANYGTESVTITYAPLCSGFAYNCFTTWGTGFSVTLGSGQSTKAWVSYMTRADSAYGVEGKVKLGLTTGTQADTGDYTVRFAGAGAVKSVAVTPTVAVAVPSPNELKQYEFMIKNTGDTVSAFNYTLTCPTSVAKCALLHPSTTDSLHDTTPMLWPNNSIGVTVTYKAATATTTMDTLRLLARHSIDSATKATGKLAIRTYTPSAVEVVANAINPGTSVSRGACLTIAVSDASAYECGELRVVHPLPAVTTLGKTRAPTLVYSSRAASPSVMLAANVMVLDGADSIRAVVTTPHPGYADKVIASTKFGWTSITQRADNRITIPLDTGIASFNTGAYSYALQIKAYKNGDSSSTSQPDTGTFVVVNRSGSPFGAGWWLDGLETIQPIDTYRNLWIGGDGSTRMYRRTNTTDSVFLVSPAVDRPDTLIMHANNSGYRRRLPNGAYVEFNSSGQHTSTRDVLGHLTTFTYDAVLTKITVPVPSGGTERAYTFDYGPDSSAVHVTRIVAIHAPGIAGDDRVTTLKARGSYGQLTEIPYLPSSNALSTAVTFTYDNSTPARRMATRTDRMSHVTTFGFDPYGGLIASTFDMASTGANIVHGFCPSETMSLTTCSGKPVPVATAYGWWDGPRTDAADTTRFYINRFGAPDTTINALGQKTRLERSLQWPMLAASVISPTNVTTSVVRNARGLDSVVTVTNALGNNAPSTTTYTWHSKWDHPVTVIGPSGERTDFAFDTAYPLQLWQRAGTHDSAKVFFSYASGTRQLEYIQTAHNSTSQRERIQYETAYGNPSAITSALQVTTTMHTDALGRVDSVTTPIDATHARTDVTTYDLLDRVTRTASRGPATSYVVATNGATVSVPAQTMTVINAYDKNGALTSVTRVGSPDSTSLASTWTYDAASRVRTETRPGGGVDSTSYDPAGNVTRVRTRRNYAIVSAYDALNRLTSRVVPAVHYDSSAHCSVFWPSDLSACNTRGYRFPFYGASVEIAEDVSEFTYDPTGGIATANNGAAQISRTYYPNGQLKADTLRIRTYNNPGATAFTQHVYGIEHSYDASGRPISLTHPASLAGCTGCPQSFQYTPGKGTLAQVTGLNGTVFGFTYDHADRLKTATAPGNVTRTWAYDEGSRVTARADWVALNGYSQLHLDSLWYDQGGRVTRTLAAISPGILHDVRTAYAGLGAVAYTGRSKNNAFASTEQMTVDAYGSMLGQQQFTDVAIRVRKR